MFFAFSHRVRRIRVPFFSSSFIWDWKLEEMSVCCRITVLTWMQEQWKSITWIEYMYVVRSGIASVRHTARFGKKRYYDLYCSCAFAVMHTRRAPSTIHAAHMMWFNAVLVVLTVVNLFYWKRFIRNEFRWLISSFTFFMPGVDVRESERASERDENIQQQYDDDVFMIDWFAPSIHCQCIQNTIARC